MPIINFKITNLTCPACVKLSEMALKKIPGVTDVQVDLGTGAAFVEADNDVKGQITDALAKVDKKVAF